MGYTHYWTLNHDAPDWRAFWINLCRGAARVAELCEAGGIALAGWDGIDYSPGAPITSERGIAFNGTGGDAFEHETFVLEPFAPPPDSIAAMLGADLGRGTAWSFCKTARKPYDVAVTGILLWGRTLDPECIAISSDGNWEGDWEPARAIVARMLAETLDADEGIERTTAITFAGDPLGQPPWAPEASR